jgi:TonB family protein
MTENWKQWEGQVVDGRFPLSQYLGGGEHSAVFVTASDDPAIQNAAIKLVQTDPDDAEIQLARWESAARLSHPHLMRLFQMGRCRLDGRELIYVVMERADEDLSQVLPQRPLSPSETMEALEPALDALAYVHSQGFVHGRVRPSNMLAAGDRLKLSSDRLRRAGEPRSPSEAPGAGDAPEIADAGITPAADVWSLGVTMVEALTQRAPESASPPELPAPFHDIVRHCLDRDPARRWTVPEIRRRLKQPPIAVPEETTAAEPRKAAARGLYGGLAAAFVLVVAAIVVGPWLLNRRAAPGEPAAAAPQPVQASLADSSSEQSPAETAPTPVPPPQAVEPAAPVPGAALGGVLHQVLPDVPRKALNSIHGTVRVGVKIHVDASGNVTDAGFASGGPSRYFAARALEAARQWTFSPPAPNEWLLRFEFEKSGVSVHSAPAIP